MQPEDIRLQTRLTMRNHKEILDWLGLDWKNVVKLTRFQKRLDESKQIEAVLAATSTTAWPPMSVYEIDGLSSPQARLESTCGSSRIRRPSQNGRVPAPVKGCSPAAPPRGRRAHRLRPGILVSKDMDLVFMSALTAYPFNVDPWNPGEFRLPTDARRRARWPPRISSGSSRRQELPGST